MDPILLRFNCGAGLGVIPPSDVVSELLGEDLSDDAWLCVSPIAAFGEDESPAACCTIASIGDCFLFGVRFFASGSLVGGVV